MQKYSDFGLNFTGSNDVKKLTTSQSPPPSQFGSFSVVGLGHSPQDACLTVSPDLHVTKTEKKVCALYAYNKRSSNSNYRYTISTSLRLTKEDFGP